MTEQEYYTNLQFAKELYHHGVDGQHWGVKNGPPYPLDAQGKAAVKKQAMRNHDDSVKNRYNKDRKLVKSGDLGPNSSEYKEAIKDQIFTSANKWLINDKDRARYYRNVANGKNAVGSAIGSYMTSTVRDFAVSTAVSTGAGLAATAIAGPLGGITYSGLYAACYAGATAGYTGMRIKRIASVVKQNSKN